MDTLPSYSADNKMQYAKKWISKYNETKERENKYKAKPTQTVQRRKR